MLRISDMFGADLIVQHNPSVKEKELLGSKKQMI